MKLLIFEDTGQYFLGHLIKKAPLSTKEKEEGLEPKSSLRAGLWKATSPTIVTKKWIGLETLEASNCFSELALHSPMWAERNVCRSTQEGWKDFRNPLQTSSISGTTFGPDADLWTNHHSPWSWGWSMWAVWEKDRYLKRNWCFARKGWQMGTGQATHSVHDLILSCLGFALNFFSPWLSQTVTVQWQWPALD